MTLSIIVPIYKAEEYLAQCIQSVLDQTFPDFELILVDDGSPDNCGKICDEFAYKDSRIKVIHKQNEGSILARRTGFENSFGKYVSFVDADDWIEKDFYKSIFEKMAKEDLTSIDVYCCGFTSEFDDGTNKSEHNWLESGFYKEEKFKYFLEHCLYNGKYFENGIVPALWCKIFKRDLVKMSSHINPMIKMGEDAALSYCVFATSKYVFVDNENTMYHYRRLNNSMSTSYDSRYFERIEILYNHFMAFFLEHNVQCLIEESYYYFTFLIVIGINSELSAKKHLKSKNSLMKILKKRWIHDVMSKTKDECLSKQANFWKRIVLKYLKTNY